MHSELLDNDLENSKYKLAGYCAIASSILALPLLVVFLTCTTQIGPRAILVPVNISLIVIVTFCSLYAFYHFKCYLNEYYEFHDIDKYVLPIIIFSIMGSSIGIFNSTAGAISQTYPGLKILSTIATLAISISAGVISIVFSVNLLKLPVSLHGMLKTYVYITIAASICFMLFFLGPIGVILGAVTDFMLGIILLKTPEKLEVEFV